MTTNHPGHRAQDDLESRRAEKFERQLTPIGELLSEPDEVVSYVAEDRIPAGALVLLAGKPKAGKSTIARELVFAVATGDEWVGSACVSGLVWLIALEDKRAEVRRHFKLMGATGAEPIRIFTRERGTLDLLPGMSALARTERPVLIVVDTLQRLIKARDLNDYAETTSRMDPLLNLARETGAALVLLHHCNKFGQGLDGVLGSTALTGSADNVLVLTRAEKYRLLSSTQRIGPDLPDTVIAFDERTGRSALAGTRTAADERGMEHAILTALIRAHTSLTQDQLEAAVVGRTGLKRAALRRLLEGGRVLRAGAGSKGNPYLYSAGSCSLVPMKYGEQANASSPHPASACIPGTNSCSHVPGNMVVPGQSATADDDEFERF